MTVENQKYQYILNPRSIYKFWVGNVLVILLLIFANGKIISQDSNNQNIFFPDSILTDESIDEDIFVNPNDSLIHYDSAYYEVRNFNQLKVQNFQKDKDFSYLKLKREPFDLIEFLLTLFDEYILKPFQKIIGITRAPFIMLMIIIVLAGFIAYQMIRKKANTGIDKNLIQSSGFKNSLDNIHEIDFDREIENALKLADYSSAVRLQYLKLLKNLFDIGILKYKISKTNTDYLNELRNTELSLSFRRLSDIFNYVSYGKFIISSDDYSLIINRFKDFSIKVDGIE